MEKVRIKTATDVEGKPFINLLLEDGRKGASYNKELLEKIGQEVELEVKEGKPFNNVTQYYFSLPKAAGGNKGFPPKDYKFSKQDSALNHAINSVKLTGKEVTSANILALAEVYFTWFNSK